MENHLLLQLFLQIVLILGTFTIGVFGYVLLSSRVGKKARTGTELPLRFL
ncbi:hypothetical protein [Rufibacter immobilis]|nr:hypothetical protein [Rufibacter immobilis]